MDSTALYSLLLDRQGARRSFAGVGTHNLVLAVLAGLPPESAWEGCVVFDGESPEDEVETLCIGVQGGPADVVQERLAEAFERVGVPVLKLYEGGPEIRERLAVVRGGVWADPVTRS